MESKRGLTLVTGNHEEEPDDSRVTTATEQQAVCTASCALWYLVSNSTVWALDS